MASAGKTPRAGGYTLPTRATLCTTANAQVEMTLWVIRRHSAAFGPSPLYIRKQTFAGDRQALSALV